MDSKKPYFANSKVNLYHTDSLEWLEQRESNSIDVVFADPPYFLTSNPNDISYKGKWDKSSGTKEDFNFQFKWIKEAYRVLKDDGVIWITGTHHSIYQCGFALQLVGFHLINEISWYKPSRRFENLRNNLAFSHETIVFARKSKDVRHYLNWKYLTNSQDKFHKQGLTMPTIWDIKPCPRSEVDWHKTPKPVELLKRIIMLSSKPNALILDPFNGSGTTGIAIIELGYGRKYIGLDNSKEYLDKTIERMEEKEKKLEIVREEKEIEQNKTTSAKVENKEFSKGK